MSVLIPFHDLSGSRPHVGLRVWLADLTYTQQAVSSEIMPQAIGGLATYAATRMSLAEPIRIFKYPEKLADALRDDPPPDVIGFSHYVWNANLALRFAAAIKEVFPDVVTVFGGPHYPLHPGEQARFLRDRLGPAVDFYVDREGEPAFAEFLIALARAQGDHRPLHGSIAGVHSIDDAGQAHTPPPGPRLSSLVDIPSPYLAGLLDEFFDGTLIPTIQTNRGCPFSCSFCVEGTRYYSKVAKKEVDRVRDELLYIGARMQPLLREKRARNELLITDSNFGMYPEDLNICDAIAECQDVYGWPRYVDLTTGKNKRDRVLEAISRAGGVMTLSGAVQSLDPKVLSNVRRSNINADQLMEVALAASEKQTGTYSEVILGLPEDSKEAHFATLEKLIEAGFDRLNMFQLTLLPGSDMWSENYREKYRMKTRFRVIPRCFGEYQVLGSSLSAAEIDEVCVELPSMPFEDYLDCRQMNLFIAACYNDGSLDTIVKLLRTRQLSVFGWLRRMQEMPFGPDLTRVIDDFRTETATQLWESREQLGEFSRTNVRRYIEGELGSNLLYTYRVRVLVEALDDVTDLAVRAAQAMCAESPADTEPLESDFLREAGDHHRLRLLDLLNPDQTPHRQTARFDLVEFARNPGSPRSFLLREPAVREYWFSAEQSAIIEGYLEQYGANSRGAGRMFTRVRVGDLFRNVRLVAHT